MMNGRRAALVLVALAALGPAVAIAANAFFSDSDAFAHSRLEGLWVLSVVWALACLVGAWTQWRHD
jgi:hypothetical protein